MVCGAKRIRSLYLLPDARNASQALHHTDATRPGLPLHYRCRDYAPLQSRPPCRDPWIAAGATTLSPTEQKPAEL